MNVAVEENDLSICHEIERQGIDFRNCVSETAKHNAMSEYCREIDNTDYQYDCIYNTALKNNDASHCQWIESNGTRDKCYHNVAVTKKDTAVCANIQDVHEKNNCENYTELKELQGY